MKLRERLIRVVRDFRNPMMLTLTVDPALFAGPWEALRWLREERAVARLMRELRARGHVEDRWFSVVEFQENGFPHFHVLADAAFVPIEEVEEVWGRFSPRPLAASSSGPSSPDDSTIERFFPFSDRRPVPIRRRIDPTGKARNGLPLLGWTGFSTGFNLDKVKREDRPVYAARYVTKYLTKPPRHGFPSWLLELPVASRVRRYSTSHGFWGEGGRARGEVVGVNRPSSATYRQKVAACGQTSMLVEVAESIDTATGEARVVKRTMKGWVNVTRALVRTIDDGDNPRRHRRVLHGANVARAVVMLSRVAGRRVEFEELKRRGRRIKPVRCEHGSDDHGSVQGSGGGGGERGDVGGARVAGVLGVRASVPGGGEGGAPDDGAYLFGIPV